MQEIQLSDLQKNVNSIIDSVKSSKSLLITDKEKVLAKIVPVSPAENRPKSWLGCMKGSGRIIGDIVSPAEDADAWEVLSE